MDTLFRSAAARISEETREEQKTVRNPLAPFDFAHPSIIENVASVTGGRGYKDKFAQGFLSGVGGSSQFQSVNQAIGLRRGFYNDNLDPLLRSTQTLEPSWERSYAFAPGLGLDALKSKIVWTPDASGDVGGPSVPNYGYINRTGRGGDNDPQAIPIMPLEGADGSQNRGLEANTAPPAVLSGSGGTGLEEFMKEAHSFAEGATKRRLAAQRMDAKRALG